ncbi:MAG: TM0996/MTH895 family glutaredoxin-like protein [Armatimonadetes bacterium]|nr:TM0996/MTH895 family glutaredoxin-like protein [Armatimonadota bacterium]
MKIEVLGSGCANCVALEAEAKAAAAELGIEAEIVKVQDVKEIVKRGVLTTPGLVIDGKVKSAGRVVKKGQIATWLTEAAG